MSSPRHSGTGLVLDSFLQRHKTGPGHPESPERLHAIEQGLHNAGQLEHLFRLPARAATYDQVLLCHTPHYLEIVRHDVARGASTLSTGDTLLSESSLDVALLAAGAAVTAVDAVFQRRVKNAFVVSRPPGHHATSSRGMGFCIFNNVAIAARYAQRTYGVERVLIADWDVHHGNGTQDIFYRDPSVFYFSTHQFPWYPGTGAADEKGDGAAEGTTLNCPFPAGAGHAEIFQAFRKKLLPAAAEFRPDLVLISAGFDSRKGDPLGRFQLKDVDFAELTALMLEIAERHSGGRLVSILEGGYDLAGLAHASAAHVQALRDASGNIRRAANVYSF
jgi:acetoin utilization deacetylase AcuC-like enzyme